MVMPELPRKICGMPELISFALYVPHNLPIKCWHFAGKCCVWENGFLDISVDFYWNLLEALHWSRRTKHLVWALVSKLWPDLYSVMCSILWKLHIINQPHTLKYNYKILIKRLGAHLKLLVKQCETMEKCADIMHFSSLLSKASAPGPILSMWTPVTLAKLWNNTILVAIQIWLSL